MTERPAFPPGVVCPVPLRGATIQLAHGGGGRRMRELIESLLLPAFGGPSLRERHDAAVVANPGASIAITTDTYVVKPRFFPGGDIGKLAVLGTVNDLAMAGARAKWMSLGLVLEEGLALEELVRVIASVRASAAASGVEIVTGDTKVVDRGHGDGIFINTTGVGVVREGVRIAPGKVEPDDRVILSGDVGRHGIAVMSVREGLAFEAPIESDCASVAPLVDAMLDAGIDVHCLRDPTRGGLASALNEIALDAKVDVEIAEDEVPVSDPVAAACEILGLDPLYVACEGRLIAFVARDDTDRALAALRSMPEGASARVIGSVASRGEGHVSLRTRLGVLRSLDLLSGEQLPRIC
jgi:hydrogenase expression/formation protein HypE